MIPLFFSLLEQDTLWSNIIPVSQGERERVHMVGIKEEGRNRRKTYFAGTRICTHRLFLDQVLKPAS